MPRGELMWVWGSRATQQSSTMPSRREVCGQSDTAGAGSAGVRPRTPQRRTQAVCNGRGAAVRLRPCLLKKILENRHNNIFICI